MPAPKKYPDELRERAVRLVLDGGRPSAHIANDLGIHREALRQWVRQAEADAGWSPPARSKVRVTVTSAPPDRGSTVSRHARMRTRSPTGRAGEADAVEPVVHGERECSNVTSSARSLGASESV
jgi:transposase-like protein